MARAYTANVINPWYSWRKALRTKIPAALQIPFKHFNKSSGAPPAPTKGCQSPPRQSEPSRLEASKGKNSCTRVSTQPATARPRTATYKPTRIQDPHGSHVSPQLRHGVVEASYLPWERSFVSYVPPEPVRTAVCTGCVAPSDIFFDYNSKQKLNATLQKISEGVEPEGKDDSDADSLAVVYEAPEERHVEQPTRTHSHPTAIPPSAKNCPSFTPPHVHAPPMESRTSSSLSQASSSQFSTLYEPSDNPDDIYEDESDAEDGDSDWAPKTTRSSRKRVRDDDAFEDDFFIPEDEETAEGKTHKKARRGTKRQKTDEEGQGDVQDKVLEFLLKDSYTCLEPGCGHEFDLTADDNGTRTIKLSEIGKHYVTHFVECKDPKTGDPVLRCNLTHKQGAQVEEVWEKGTYKKTVVTLCAFPAPCAAHYTKGKHVEKSIARHVQSHHLLTHLRMCSRCLTPAPDSRADSLLRHVGKDSKTCTSASHEVVADVVDLGVVKTPGEKWTSKSRKQSSQKSRAPMKKGRANRTKGMRK